MNIRLVFRLVCAFSVAIFPLQRLDSQPGILHQLAESQRAGVTAVASWPYAGQAVYPAGRFIIKADNQGRVNFDTALARALQRGIDSIRFVYGLPGISAALLIPGQGTWLGAAGFSTFSPLVSIQPEMRFSIASNTKSFVSTIVLQLQEEGKLSLDDSIGHYLPPFPNISGSITIRQLLNMTSGLYDYGDDSSPLWNAVRTNPDRYWTPEDILTTFVGPPLQAPGISYSYSNTNGILAGMIVRDLEQTTISKQIHQRISGPLALQETYFPLEDTLVGPIAHPWMNNIDSWSLPYYGNAGFSTSWTAGAMFSTAENSARWASALYSGQLLTPASLTQMLTFVPAVKMWPDRVHQLGYGLFVAQNSLLGKTFWGHTGAAIGYLSWIAYYPPTGVAAVVLLNVYNDAGLSAMDRALIALYREYFRTLPAPPAAPPRTLFAASGTDETSQLHVANPISGAATLVGPTQYGTILSIAVHPHNLRVYGLCETPGPEIVQINPSTGEALPLTMLPFKSGLARGMAFTREGESIVSLIDGRLYRVDVNSGNATLLSTAAIGFYNLALNPMDGELWGTSWDYPFNVLYKINPLTGDATPIGSSGFNLPTMSLAFDYTGNLYGVISNGAIADNLIRIDTLTGIGTLVGSLGVSKVYGITFAPDASAIREVAGALPDRFALHQNYPNPFNPKTGVRFQVPGVSDVKLVVYDLLGREVAVLVNEKKAPGSYEVQFDGSGFSSGVYFYKLTAGVFSRTRSMLLVK